MSLRTGDLVKLRNLSPGNEFVGLVIRVRPCDFTGSEHKRICKVTWLRTKRSHEYVDDQLVKA